MSLSSYLENALLNHAFGGVPFAMPEGLYLGLFLTNPGQTGAGTEVSGVGYVRQPVAGTVTGNVFSIPSTIDFPVAGSAWGTIQYVGLFDAVSGGNFLAPGTLQTIKTINFGGVFRETSLTIELD